MNKLPKTKLNPRERRHAKQVALLTRWYKKQKAAIKTLAKSERMIPRLEKSLQRYDKMLANAPLERTEPVEEPSAPQVLDELQRPERVPESKPKRKRKPKTDVLGLVI
jgi:hypothetical protein